jgi:hypothetical protein
MLVDEADGIKADDFPKGRVRFRIYWVTSIGATLLFLLFVLMMMMVPGVLLSEKLWMLSIAAVALAFPLGIGVWRFGTTEAPIMEWPLGPLMGVILLLEEAQCVISILILLVKRPL